MTCTAACPASWLPCSIKAGVKTLYQGFVSDLNPHPMKPRSGRAGLATADSPWPVLQSGSWLQSALPKPFWENNRGPVTDGRARDDYPRLEGLSVEYQRCACAPGQSADTVLCTINRHKRTRVGRPMLLSGLILRVVLRCFNTNMARIQSHPLVQTRTTRWTHRMTLRSGSSLAIII